MQKLREWFCENFAGYTFRVIIVYNNTRTWNFIKNDSAVFVKKYFIFENIMI